MLLHVFTHRLAITAAIFSNDVQRPAYTKRWEKHGVSQISSKGGDQPVTPACLHLHTMGNRLRVAANLPVLNTHGLGLACRAGGENHIGQTMTAAARLGGERGFTLVEMLIATVVVVIGLVAVAQLVPTSMMMNANNRSDGTALVIAQKQMEAYSKSKTSLQTAVERAEQTYRGYQAVSVTPTLSKGRPVAVVSLVQGTQFRSIAEPLQ